jgi:uncharacterized sulfatase
MDLTRRSFLAHSAAARLLGADRPRPNILWLSCEDSSPVVGCYGDPFAKTPTIDALARQGVRYSNAFTVAGVCAPSRSGIITGMYPSTLGSMHMRCQAALPPHVRCFPAYLREAGYYCTNNAKTDYNFPVPADPWDESSKEAHWRKRPQGKPFFSVFNFQTTHESQVRLSDENYARLTRRLTPAQRQDPAKLKLPPYFPDTPVVRHDWARSYELMTAVDYQVADMLKQLEEDGLAENTIVFFWSDHGAPLPRSKRWLYDSGTRVPLIIRTPEKFRTAGQGRPGTADEQLVSFLDLAPTVLHLAGVPVPAQFQGRAFLGENLTPPRQYVFGARDRMDERYDMIRTVREKRYRYVRNYEWFKPYYQYMNTAEGSPVMQELRRVHAEGKLPKAAAQFMADTKPWEELYDLQNDPHEVNNLASKAEMKPVLERMRGVHENWVRETRDLGLIPEPELVEREKKLGSRYAILRQPGSAELMERLLKPTLNDPDAAVRYHAVRQAKSKDAEKLLADPAVVVRIAAAGKTGNLAVLETELKNPEVWVRLFSANALDELGEKARPAIPALKAAMAEKGQDRYVIRVLNRVLNKLLGTENKVA